MAEYDSILQRVTVNGVTLHCEVHGEGNPVVLVHGSWSDAREWNELVVRLARRFRVLVYDRRGHSRSARSQAPPSVDDHGEDLAALLTDLDLAPAHVVANSYGGNIALRLACRRPALFRSLSCHEPPLFDVLADDPESRNGLNEIARILQAVAARIAGGDPEGGARLFAEEVALEPGAWEKGMSAEERATWIRNADTFRDEINDPNMTTIDPADLRRLPITVQLTQGSGGAPLFRRVVDRLVEWIPRVSRDTVQGAEHVPHITTPERYLAVITRELERRTA